MEQTSLKTPTSRCRAGLSWSDVTPPVGIYHRFWGAASHDRAAGVHRPLRVSVLVLASAKSGETLLSETSILVALDHCLFRPDDMDELRSATAALIGVTDDRLLFTFSHTHSGGHIARSRSNLPGGELIGPYLDGLPQRIADTSKAAQQSLQPVTITYAQVDCRMGCNRDYWDGEFQTRVCGMNPAVEFPLPVTVVRLSKGVDDVIGTGTIGTGTIGTVVNYPCHPTTLAWENELISPDYVGAMRETVEAATGVPCLFLLAPCGDVGPKYGFVGETEAADQNGRQLGYAALSALESMPPAGNDLVYSGPVISGATIGVWNRTPHDTARIQGTQTFRSRRWSVPLPYLAELEKVDETEQQLMEYENEESAYRRAGDEPSARDARAMAERCRRTLERIRPLPAGEHYPLGVEVRQMGDVFWVAVEGEPYWALKQQLQERFPQTPFLVTVLSEGARCGYLPTREVYKETTLYQVSIAVLAPGSLEILIDAVAGQIESWMDRDN